MSADQKSDFPSVGEALRVVVSLLQAVLVWVAVNMTSEIKEATKSINELNVKIEVLVQKTVNQQDRINELGARVSALEQKLRR